MSHTATRGYENKHVGGIKDGRSYLNLKLAVTGTVAKTCHRWHYKIKCGVTCLPIQRIVKNTLGLKLHSIQAPIDYQRVLKEAIGI